AGSRHIAHGEDLAVGIEQATRSCLPWWPRPMVCGHHPRDDGPHPQGTAPSTQTGLVTGPGSADARPVDSAFHGVQYSEPLGGMGPSRTREEAPWPIRRMSMSLPRTSPGCAATAALF